MEGEGLGRGPRRWEQLPSDPVPPAGAPVVRTGLEHCRQRTSSFFHGTRPSISHLAGVQ